MVQVAMVTASGEEHGLVNVLSNSVPFNDFKNYKPEHKACLEKEKKNDARIVKAKYQNSRGQHERLTKAYCKYAGDPIQMWHFIPERIYEVPFGLVNEVNDKSKILKKRSGLVSVDDAPVKQDRSPLDRDEDGDWLHQFVPIGF